MSTSHAPVTMLCNRKKTRLPHPEKEVGLIDRVSRLALCPYGMSPSPPFVFIPFRAPPSTSFPHRPPSLLPPRLPFDAKKPPWRGTAGTRQPGSTTTSKGLHGEWAQLWKDMGRDVVEIRGDRLDLSTSASGAVAVGGGDGGGGGGGTAGAAGGNPEVVLAPLAKEIERVGVEGGIAGLSEVQCFLAARWGGGEAGTDGCADENRTRRQAESGRAGSF